MLMECQMCSVGPKAEVLRPQPKIQDLRLRLRWPKFFAIPTAEGFYWQFSQVLPKWRLKCVFHYTEMWIMIVLSLKIKTDPLFNEILVKFPYLVEIIPGKIFYDICYRVFFILRLRLRPTAKGRSFSGPNIRLRPKVKIVPTVQHWNTDLSVIENLISKSEKKFLELWIRGNDPLHCINFTILHADFSDCVCLKKLILK